MLKLLGFPASNYYNMVKMALMEKGAEYEDVRVYSGSSEEFLARSAMGKVPALETPQGFLSETSVILDYIEDAVEGRSLNRIFDEIEDDKGSSAKPASSSISSKMRLRDRPSTRRTRMSAPASGSL